MAESKSSVKVVVLLLIIAVALAFVIKQAMPTRYRPRDVDWVCDSCGHAFVAPYQLGPTECPVRACGGDAVRTFIYYDTATGDLVEVYRVKPAPGIAEESMEPGERLIKVPGGEWAPDYRGEDETGFPVPVERPGDLRYAPPGSEYRQ